MRIDSSGLIGKVLKENRFISKEVDLSSSIAEVAFIFDVANSNPNGSLPENMPRQIMSTGQIYATQESIKKRAKDLVRRVFEEKGLYEEKPEGKMTDKLTLWVSGRPVTADGRFKEIVGEFNNEIRKSHMEYFLSVAIDALSFGAVLPILDTNINITGPLQILDAVSIHPVEIISEGGTAAFTTDDEKGVRSLRQEYKVGYALMVGGGVFLGKYLKGRVFSSRFEDLSELTLEDFYSSMHLELWVKALWSGIERFTTSKNIRPIAVVFSLYGGSYVKYFLVRNVQEQLWKRLSGRKVGNFVDAVDELVKLLKEIGGEAFRIWVNESVIDTEGFLNGEEILLR